MARTWRASYGGFSTLYRLELVWGYLLILCVELDIVGACVVSRSGIEVCCDHILVDACVKIWMK